jgi:hypothetical protein
VSWPKIGSRGTGGCCGTARGTCDGTGGGDGVENSEDAPGRDVIRRSNPKARARERVRDTERESGRARARERERATYHISV